jgi:hypothetical protein
MLYKQIIKKISNESNPLQALGFAKDKLIQIIRQGSNVDFTQLFIQKLNVKLIDRELYEEIRK